MKRQMIHAASAISLFALASCAPDLARAPYGENEMLWKEYIQTSYKGWQPPPPPPPMAEVPTIQVNQIAPEAPPSVESIDITIPDAPGAIDAGANLKGPATGKFEEYVVQKGDTLSGISQKYYKTANKWQTILDANKDVVTTPKALRPGVKLRIPSL